MRNLQDTFETPKRSFISRFLICMTLQMQNLVTIPNVGMSKLGLAGAALSRLLDLFGIWRSSHRRCSVRKDVLRNFAKFRVRPATLLKKKL